MTEYSPIRDYLLSCEYGTARLREQMIRQGVYKPRPDDETELRWASEGPLPARAVGAS